jgi:hypothetical protein
LIKVLKWAAIGIGGLFVLLIVIILLVGSPEATEAPPAAVPVETPTQEEQDNPQPTPTLEPTPPPTPSPPATPESGVGDGSAARGPGFTVMEYQLYRAIIDMPQPVSEEQALRRIGERYGVPPEEVRTAAENVQETLFLNGWFGTRESEIRHDTDWEGEQP